VQWEEGQKQVGNGGRRKAGGSGSGGEEGAAVAAAGVRATSSAPKRNAAVAKCRLRQQCRPAGALLRRYRPEVMSSQYAVSPDTILR